MMKNTVVGVITLLLLATVLCLSGCTGNNPGKYESSNFEIVGDIKTAPVIFDRSYGSTEENIRRETVYSYEEISLDEVIQAMSDWSGLDFLFDVQLSGGVNDRTAVIDWKADSSLILGYPPENQESRLSYASEEHTDFHRFHDADSLRWYMMDSVWRTMKENLYTDEIYFTMDGGKELVFDELFPINMFPADIPYVGSPFYFSHSDNRGE